MVAGKQILCDIEKVFIKSSGDGKSYDRSVVRGGDKGPGQFVAAASTTGRHAMERANGLLKEAAPGFVEVSTDLLDTPPSAVMKDIRKCFGVE